MTYVNMNFYRKNKHKYQLDSNEEFLKWYLTSLDGSFNSDYKFGISDYEELITLLTWWYQQRYTDYMLEPYDYNPMGERLSHVKDISKELDITQFLSRLVDNHYRLSWLMDCDYGMTGNSSGNYTEIINGRKVSKGWVGLRIYDKRERWKSYGIDFESSTGNIVFSDIPEFVNLSLEEALQSLKQSNVTILDYSELESVVRKHEFDVELRHRLLQLTAVKILYSGSEPSLGYKRAKKFIEDMNQELGLLLSTDEIDEIYEEYQKELKIFNNNPARYYRQYVKRLR